MVRPIEIRTDISGDILRFIARNSRDAKQVRRLLAIASICDGGSRKEAAKIGATSLQVLRDWVVRFNAEGPDGLIDRKAPGRTPVLNDKQRKALAQAIETELNPYFSCQNRWRLRDLVQLLKDRFDVSVSETTVGRELRAMGYPKPSQPEHTYAGTRVSQNHRGNLSARRTR